MLNKVRFMCIFCVIGFKQHVTINVTDSDNSVNIQKLQILDIGNNDRIIKELPLRNIGEFYMTEAFVSPNYTFKIAVRYQNIKIINMNHIRV